MFSPSATEMELDRLVQGLPVELRRLVLKQACKGMTIDQRRAAGILPGKLVVPSHLVWALNDKVTARRVVFYDGYARESGRWSGGIFLPLPLLCTQPNGVGPIFGFVQYYIINIIQVRGRPTDRSCSYIDPDTRERAVFAW